MDGSNSGSDAHQEKEVNGQDALSSADTSAIDLEQNRVHNAGLFNDIIKDFTWKAVNVMVKDRTTKQPLSILDNASGVVKAGEMLAIMGPSGSGKTTLLNALAHRPAAAGATTTGEMFSNGQHLSLRKLRQFSSYVEQEDALIGSLTVRETMEFAAGLSLSSYVEQENTQFSSRRGAIANPYQVYQQGRAKATCDGLDQQLRPRFATQHYRWHADQKGPQWWTEKAPGCG